MNKLRSFIKYITWGLGALTLILVGYAYLLFMKGYEEDQIPCTIDDEYANTYRREGGIKKDSSFLIGEWTVVSVVSQYLDRDGELDCYERVKPFHEFGRQMTITEDSLICDKYPFWKAMRRDYRVDEDSIYFNYDSSLDGEYIPTSHYYEFLEDTLVFVSIPNGHCGQVTYQYYIKYDSLQSSYE
jgi:hypothetical protein